MAFDRKHIAKIATLDANLKQLEQKYLALKDYSVPFAFVLDYPEPPTREPNARGRAKQSFDLEINHSMPEYRELMIIIRQAIERDIKQVVNEFKDIGIDIDHEDIMIQLIKDKPVVENTDPKE